MYAMQNINTRLYNTSHAELTVSALSQIRLVTAIHGNCHVAPLSVLLGPLRSSQTLQDV